MRNVITQFLNESMVISHNESPLYERWNYVCDDMRLDRYYVDKNTISCATHHFPYSFWVSIFFHKNSNDIHIVKFECEMDSSCQEITFKRYISYNEENVLIENGELYNLSRVLPKIRVTPTTVSEDIAIFVKNNKKDK